MRLHMQIISFAEEKERTTILNRIDQALVPKYKIGRDSMHTSHYKARKSSRIRINLSRSSHIGKWLEPPKVIHLTC